VLAAQWFTDQNRFPSERGLQGIPGVPVVIQKWRLDRDYIAVPVMSDGRRGPPLELRSLFEQFHTEAR
jgi:hypothetical protein